MSNRFHNDPDGDGDRISDTWELAHFASLTNATADSDWDGDGFRDGDEFRAGTAPTDSSSSLHFTSVTFNEARTEAELRWQSVSGRFYSVYCSSSLVGQAETLLEEHIPASPAENVYTDRVDHVGSRFYRLSVER